MTNSSKKTIAIWGASGHARVVADALKLLGYEIGCFLDNIYKDSDGQRFNDCLIVARDTVEQICEQLVSHHIKEVALGFGHCKGRDVVGRALVEYGICPLTVVHPTACVSNRAVIGRGVFVGSHVIVDPEVIISDYAILNHASVICHDSVIGHAAHVCPGACICGSCKVGELSWIGAGSIVKDGVTIGSRTFVGSGSNVVCDLPDDVMAYGNPAVVQSSVSKNF